MPEMAADIVLEIVSQEVLVRFDVTRHAQDLAEPVEGRPAGIDNVDEQEDLLLRGVDEDVTRTMRDPAVFELQGLVADVEGLGLVECNAGRWASGVGTVGKLLRSGCGGNVCHVLRRAVKVCAADVVGMVVGVDDVGEGFVGQVADGCGRRRTKASVH